LGLAQTRETWCNILASKRRLGLVLEAPVVIGCCNAAFELLVSFSNTGAMYSPQDDVYSYAPCAPGAPGSAVKGRSDKTNARTLSEGATTSRGTAATRKESSWTTSRDTTEGVRAFIRSWTGELDRKWDTVVNTGSRRLGVGIGNARQR
jgi:hypothetical protein